MSRRPWSTDVPARSRRRPLPLLALAVAALAALLAPAVRPGHVDAQASLATQATLTVLTSPVELQRASGNRDAAPSGTSVVVGDRVFTGPGGTAKLTFFQGTEVEIAPDTEVMVQEMTRRVGGASTVSFGQAVGSTVAKVAALLNPASRVQVSTQSAVAVVRGTELEVTVTKEQVQVFKSVSGNFDVVAGGQVQRVKDGEVTVVPPPPPVAPPPTTRDARTVGNATLSLPGGNDRPPLPPVPVAEAATLFEKVAEITAKDGPRVVVTPPVAARDLIDVAHGKPVELRPIGATPVPRPTVAPPEPTVAPDPTKVPPKPTAVIAATPEPAKPAPDASKEPVATATPACVSTASTSPPTEKRFEFGGQVVDGLGAPIGCATVSVEDFGGLTSGTTTADASGRFLAFVPTPTSGASTGYFAFSALSTGFTQQVVPTLAATIDQLFTLASSIVLKRNDTAVTGTVTSGASRTPAPGATVSLAVMVPPPTGAVPPLVVTVAQTTANANGDYSLPVASGPYSYLMVTQDDAGPYARRWVTTVAPPVLPSGNVPANLTLPTLVTSGALACDQYSAPCSITVAGTGWSAGEPVTIGVRDTYSSQRIFGTVTPSASGEIALQTVVAADPTWRTGSYFPFAEQGAGASARDVELATPYVVSKGTLPSSCAVTDATGTPSASQVKVTGVVRTVSGTPVWYACVQVTDISGGLSAYAESERDGTFAAMVPLATSTGTFTVLATKPGYTPQSVPAVLAVAGHVLDTTAVVADQAIRLAPNDATISGTVTGGAGGPPVVPGAAVSVWTVPVATSGVTQSLQAQFVTIATMTSGASGGYALSLASATYAFLEVSHSSVTRAGSSPDLRRMAVGDVAVPVGSTTRDFVLPALGVSGTTCTSAPCAVTVSGSGWAPAQPLLIDIVSQSDALAGSRQRFGTATTTGDGSVSETVVTQASLAPGTYWFSAYQADVGAQRYRNVELRSETYAVSPPPTLVASGSLACDQHGSPCSITVAGTGWSATPAVVIGAKAASGNPRIFGSVTPSASGEIASRTIVSADPSWPTGTYVLFAQQGEGASARYAELGTPYVVSAGTRPSSCAVTDATGTPSASQVKVTGVVKDAAGTPVPYACVQAHERPYGAVGFGETGASGTFAIMVTASTGDFAIVATRSGYTQSSVPVVHAAPGQVLDTTTVVANQAIRLATNDATITGTLVSGTGGPPVTSGAEVSLSTVPVATAGVAQSLQGLPLVVAKVTTGADGTYVLPLASGTYAYLRATQSGAASYLTRYVEVAAPAVMPTGMAPVNLTLPTLQTSGSFACEQRGAPCSVTISGSGWAASDDVFVGAEEVSGEYRVFEFARATTSASGAIAAQTLVASEPTWPTGTYRLFAVQDHGGSEQRFVQLGTSYVVSAGALPSSCAVTDATGTPSASQVKVTGLVKDLVGSPVPHACVQVTGLSGFAQGFGETGSDGAFAAMVPLSVPTGTFAIIATKPGYTPRSVPAVRAAAGQVLDTTTVVANQAIRLASNDATITGTLVSGTGGPPVTSGAEVSVSLVPVATDGVPPQHFDLDVATVAPGADGTYSLSVASGTYAYLRATQSGVAPYTYRHVEIADPVVQSTGMSPVDLTLPTLSATGSLTCDQESAPCSITVAGSGWSAAGAVILGATVDHWTALDFGSVTPSAFGEFASQTIVAAGADWPAGTYQAFAAQGTSIGQGGPEGRLAYLDTPYVVSAGSNQSVASVGVRSRSLTPTGTATPRPTGTATPAPTGTATPAPTGTATPRPTGTPTPAPTGTPTPAPTGTPTPPPTGTPTPALTPGP